VKPYLSLNQFRWPDGEQIGNFDSIAFRANETEIDWVWETNGCKRNLQFDRQVLSCLKPGCHLSQGRADIVSVSEPLDAVSQTAYRIWFSQSSGIFSLSSFRSARTRQNFARSRDTVGQQAEA